MTAGTRRPTISLGISRLWFWFPLLECTPLQGGDQREHCHTSGVSDSQCVHALSSWSLSLGKNVHTTSVLQSSSPAIVFVTPPGGGGQVTHPEQAYVSLVGQCCPPRDLADGWISLGGSWLDLWDPWVGGALSGTNGGLPVLLFVRWPGSTWVLFYGSNQEDSLFPLYLLVRFFSFWPQKAAAVVLMGLFNFPELPTIPESQEICAKETWATGGSALKAAVHCMTGDVHTQSSVSVIFREKAICECYRL